MAEVVVVGAGVGGLAVAIRLAAAGHTVTVVERNEHVGGKLAMREIEGFRFETGPSLLTLPQVFEDLFAASGLGHTLESLCNPVRLDPICRYRWPDGSGFDTRARAADTEAAIERFAAGGAEAGAGAGTGVSAGSAGSGSGGGGAGAQWRAFHERGAKVWAVTERTFFAGPIESPRRLMSRMQSPFDLLAIDPLTTLAARAARTFTDSRLRQYAGRFATYAGSSPYLAPATLACIPYIEQEHGAWYLPGGLGVLADALTRCLADLGVVVRLGREVERIGTDAARVRGVGLVTGEWIPADIVVADVDAAHLYEDLMPDARAADRVRKAGRSSSGFVLLVGVDGVTHGSDGADGPRLMAHHNVAFSADYEREFADIFRRGDPPSDPTVYACVASVSDPGVAPEGCESWFVLVNVPSGATATWDRFGDPYRDHVLEVMARRGWDLSGRTRFVEVITPAELESRFRSRGGAIYGTSSNGRRAAFARPGNRGPKAGLYLVGGSSHPGGGLPLVAISGKIVADMVAEDIASGSVRR